MSEALLFLASMALVFGMAFGLTSGWNVVVVIWMAVALGFVSAALFQELKKWANH